MFGKGWTRFSVSVSTIAWGSCDMRVFDQNRVSVLWGEDLNDVGSFITNNPPKWSSQVRQSLTSPAREGWDLGVGYTGALALAERGWSEGAVDLSNRLATLPPNMVEAEWVYDVAGGSPDVGLFVSGDPACMRDFGHPQGRKPTVHLVVNAVASGSVSANEYKNYGTAILALVDMMENSGRSVELDLVFAAKEPNNWTALIGWNVKRAGDAADLSAIAFSLAHPAALRRIGFALLERGNPAMESHGYGRPTILTPELATLVDLQDAFLLGGVGTSYGACTNPERALRFATDEINKAAGEVLVEMVS